MYLSLQGDTEKWTKAGVKIVESKRPVNHRGDETLIYLPTKTYIEETDTNGFLVLISNEKDHIIMPKFLDYVLKGKTNAHDEGRTYKAEIRKYNKKAGFIYPTVQ